VQFCSNYHPTKLVGSHFISCTMLTELQNSDFHNGV
jgi:hypothetical protein